MFFHWRYYFSPHVSVPRTFLDHGPAYATTWASFAAGNYYRHNAVLSIFCPGRESYLKMNHSPQAYQSKQSMSSQVLTSGMLCGTQTFDHPQHFLEFPFFSFFVLLVLSINSVRTLFIMLVHLLGSLLSQMGSKKVVFVAINHEIDWSFGNESFYLVKFVSLKGETYRSKPFIVYGPFDGLIMCSRNKTCKRRREGGGGRGARGPLHSFKIFGTLMWGRFPEQTTYIVITGLVICALPSVFCLFVCQFNSRHTN